MNRWIKVGSSLVCAAVLMTACGTASNNGAGGNNQGAGGNYGTAGQGNAGGGNFGNNGAGTYGTGGNGFFGNMRNTFFGNNGQGGTQAPASYNGVSSYLEAQCRAAGIQGTKIVVLGDTVIIGQTPGANRGAGYQQGGTTGGGMGNNGGGMGNNGGAAGNTGGVGGMTGAGAGGAGGAGGGTAGATGNRTDARTVVQNILGPQAKILLVRDSASLKAIDRLKQTPTSAQSYAQDVSLVMRNALAANRGGMGGGTHR